MKIKFIEATQNITKGFNWGKFLLIRFDTEWEYMSQIDIGRPLLSAIGWASYHIWVLDLQTGEGDFFKPGGIAQHDLNKHKIWCCPMYEPFLTWLYSQDLSDLDKLPALVELPDADPAMSGYRRSGENS